MASEVRAPQSPAPAVTRAAAILDELAQAGTPLGPSELSRRLSLAKSSVANICTALAGTGMIRRTDTGYALGRRLAELGGAYLATVDEVRDFHTSCARYAEQVEETLQLATLDDGLDVVYLARRDGSAPVKLASDIGRRLPATCTAMGKAMLAALPAEEVEHRLAAIDRLPTLTDRSISAKRDLRAELARVRERGYAVDDEETAQGVFCVAINLTDGGQAGPRSAISATMLKARATEAHIASLLEALRGIAHGMGAPENRGVAPSADQLAR